MARPLTIVEPFHSLFYAPQFVALHGGHFAAEGFDVTIRTADSRLTTTGALLDGTAEISMGGLMRSFDLADRDRGRLVHFAEVNSRNGFFLLSRTPRPDFTWRDLVGRAVISFAEAPTPWQCMLTVLRREGIDPGRVTIVRDLPVAEAVAAFRAGRADFLEQGQPTVERLLQEQAAHLVASMGDATGPVPFSSFMTTPERIAGEADMLRRFTRALYAAQRWMAASSGAAIADLIAPSFPDIEPDIRRRAVDRYARQGTWARDPIVRRPGFDYLHQILLDGGFIKRRHRYEDLVDTRIATEVVKDGPVTPGGRA